MRTTVTLDSDVAQIVRARMAERHLSFKEAINSVIRDGAGSATEPFRTATAPLGIAKVNLDRALALAGEVEDEELIRKMRRGS